MAKITDKKIRTIKELYKAGHLKSHIARELNITRNTVYKYTEQPPIKAKNRKRTAMAPTLRAKLDNLGIEEEDIDKLDMNWLRALTQEERSALDVFLQKKDATYKERAKENINQIFQQAEQDLKETYDRCAAGEITPEERDIQSKELLEELEIAFAPER